MNCLDCQQTLFIKRSRSHNRAHDQISGTELGAGSGYRRFGERRCRVASGGCGPSVQDSRCLVSRFFNRSSIAKFEQDIFSRLNAEQIARANAVTKAQAQQNAAVKEELKALPMGVFGTPVPFPTATPP